MPAPSLPEDDLHLSLDISASTCPTSAPASLLPPIQTLPDPASQPPTAGVQTLELAFPFLYLSPADAAVSALPSNTSDSSSSSPPGCQPSPAPASSQSLTDPPNPRLHICQIEFYLLILFFKLLTLDFLPGLLLFYYHSLDVSKT